MRFASYALAGHSGLALHTDAGWHGLTEADAGFPGTLQSLIASGGDALAGAAEGLAKAPLVDLGKVTLLPPLSNPEKIICIGLNYKDHSAESGFKQPEYPTVFGRFNSSLIAHGAPILRPAFSEQLDYEGELVVVVGKTARDVAEADALACVAGYSIFNDASIRDYQFKSPQWTPGKNFDDTGAFGPDFVTADALPFLPRPRFFIFGRVELLCEDVRHLRQVVREFEVVPIQVLVPHVVRPCVIRPTGQGQ